MLLPGDPAPHFDCASSVNPRFSFDTVAGRYIVLSFFGSTAAPNARAFLDELWSRGSDRFDVTNAIFFGVTADRADVPLLKHEHPGRLWFYDLDLAVARKYGVATRPEGADGLRYEAQTFVLDPSLRVVAAVGLGKPVAEQVDTVLGILDAAPPLASRAAEAPVLIVPHVFEPELCRTLIDYYEARGGEDSGFMRDVGGKTVGILDYSHKRRSDCEITDEALVKTTQERLARRVVPAIRQAYQFNVTRIERHIVACYDAAVGAHFRAHRDNTTLGTAHRRFAVTLNLNSEEYEGGEIWFPEFGPKRYKAPSGAAIIFSCSLLHEVPKVTRGRRYAFLPFLYDDAAAAVRQRNRQHLGDLSGAGGPREASAARSHAPALAVAAAAQPGREVGAMAGCNAATAVATPAASSRGLPLLDGSCGCGNPDGCQTCLSAAAYPISGAGDDRVT
jgi:predicted 2-oxoglutarate/Fe(II)-dependent dioxygenase YbiX/peroxiredoxin